MIGFLRNFRAKPKILEIGVCKGASIQAWKQFFGEGSIVVGIDIDPDCAQFDAIQRGYSCAHIGSQADIQFLKKLSDEFGAHLISLLMTAVIAPTL